MGKWFVKAHTKKQRGFRDLRTVFFFFWVFRQMYEAYRLQIEERPLAHVHLLHYFSNIVLCYTKNDIWNGLIKLTTLKHWSIIPIRFCNVLSHELYSSVWSTSVDLKLWPIVASYFFVSTSHRNMQNLLSYHF